MPSSPANRIQKRFAKLCAASLLAAWAFVSVDCDTIVPRNGWSKDWGPMVPHKTFPGDCGICHVSERWDRLRDDFSFDHQKETGYALQGAHATAACLRCHNDRGPVSAYVARSCGGCHPDPHKSALGLDCARCHDQRTWRPGGLIAEHARTRFPLFGAHLAVPCERCHQQAPVGDFRGAPVDCDLCHKSDLARAKSPDHIANGWVTRCERCHSPAGWGGANFSHSFFPLTGGHSGLSCTRCHTSGTFGPIPKDCYSCHRSDYQGASDHVANGYSTDCTKCHTTSSWGNATIQHDFFPLTGGHSGVTCRRCHTSGTVGPIPKGCYSCHRSNFEGASNHVAGGYSIDCTKCHTTSSWAGAIVQHDFFPLTAGHSGLTCTKCHTSGAFGAIPKDCYSCHRSSYERAPSHVAQQYPTDCTKCHKTSSWAGATFNHKFPLQGSHNVSCTTCHQGGNTSSFTCLVCHAHNQASMDSKHRGKRGYSYSSQACYQCHRSGRAD